MDIHIGGGGLTVNCFNYKIDKVNIFACLYIFYLPIRM